VQSGKLAIVNSIDLIKLLMSHPVMKTLNAEAATAYVQRECGAVGGIARSMKAAMSPTEGQSMLQGGFGGAIVDGYSREQISHSTDTAGNVHSERLIEKSMTLPDGQGVMLQQAQQVVQVPSFNQTLFVKDMTASMTLLLNNNVDKIMQNALALNTLTMQHVDKAINVESEARKKSNRIMKALTDGFEAKSVNMQAKTFEMEKKSRELEKKTSVLEAKNLELEAHNSRLEERLNALESNMGPSGSKKARISSPKCPPRPDKNITRRASNNTFGWKKTIKGKMDKENGFQTIDEAKMAMDLFYNSN